MFSKYVALFLITGTEWTKEWINQSFHFVGIRKTLINSELRWSWFGGLYVICFSPLSWILHFTGIIRGNKMKCLKLFPFTNAVFALRPADPSPLSAPHFVSLFWGRLWILGTSEKAHYNFLLWVIYPYLPDHRHANYSHLQELLPFIINHHETP